MKETLCVFNFCLQSSELSQPWPHSFVTGSWHLTWWLFCLVTGCLKFHPYAIKTTVNQLFREPVFNYFELLLVCVIVFFLVCHFLEVIGFLELGKHLVF